MMRPKKLLQSAFSKRAPFTILDYHEVLMAKRLSCYTNDGIARHINFSEFRYEDVVD